MNQLFTPVQIGRATLNNRLARILAPNTEALILASATPHNGKKESFAELIRLLESIRRIGARLIALTGDPSSTLARASDARPSRAF